MSYVPSSTSIGKAAGVVATNRDGLGLATVLERRGQGAALASRIREQFSIELPRTPSHSTCGRIAFIATAPGTWLAMCDGAGNAFAPELRDNLEGLASICDQSDGYVVLRLTGPDVGNALCKLVPIDLHPRVFGVGAAAATAAAHMGIILWRLENDTNGLRVFEIACYRSFASSFVLALSDSAAEYGFQHL